MGRFIWGHWQRQLGLLIGGYLVVGVFALAAGVLGVWQRTLSSTELIVAAAIAAAPLAWALVADRVTGAKVGPVEVSFAEVATRLELNVTDQFQDLDALVSSDSPETLQAVLLAMRGPAASRVLVLNLRDGDYWWSTRLFLLAALADDYTQIKTIAFVEGGAANRFVGLASPTGLRQAPSRR